MACILLRRQLLQTATRRLHRHISLATTCRQASHLERSANHGVKNVFDTHVVEDLQGMTASEILSESGSRKESKMRHFTGECRLVCVVMHNDEILAERSEFWVSKHVFSSLFISAHFSSPQHPAAHGVLRMILEMNGEEILRADPVRV
jgi:NADH dehydrogenase (ubiquinone) Fe-S protein 2